MLLSKGGDKMVKRYIKDHSNTNLTQSEIEEMLQREDQ